MLKVFLPLIVVLILCSCTSTKLDATYTKSKTETKTVKVESVLSLFKVPVTVCYVLSETEIPFRVDFPLTIFRNTFTLSYETKYDLFKSEKIETHMISAHIPF
jgi:hypothetical protein